MLCYWSNVIEWPYSKSTICIYNAYKVITQFIHTKIQWPQTESNIDYSSTISSNISNVYILYSISKWIDDAVYLVLICLHVYVQQPGCVVLKLLLEGEVVSHQHHCSPCCVCK